MKKSKVKSKKILSLALIMAMVISIMQMVALTANAVTTGSTDGVYDFGGLNTTADSAGTGYNALGDKFKVPNGMYNATPSLGATSGDKTALYFSTASTIKANIMAENNGTCGSFTFKDLGVSAYEIVNSFSSFVVVLKDNLGNELANENLGVSGSIPTTSIVSLSSLYPSHGEWNVAGVSKIEITFTLSSKDVTYLQFENIKIASVSVDYLNAVTATISGQPIGSTVNVGGTANLTVTASGGVSLSYKWYSNTTNSNIGGSLIAGANAATYSAPTTALGTTYYYCVVTNTDTDAINQTKTVTSNTAAVVVNNLVNATAPTITNQPQDTTVVAGNPASVSVSASVASGDLSYKWYSNTTDSNVGGSLISGANTSTYSVTPSSAGTTYYYCVVTNTDTSALGSQTATTISDSVSVTATHGAGTYTFSGLGTVGSAGTGYTSLGDLFKVPDGMYNATLSLGTVPGDNTALYFSSASTTTAKIMAADNGTCGSFTFKDLGVSAFQNVNSFSSFVIVLKDNLGNVLTNENLGASSSSSIPTTSRVNLSSLYPSHGEWNVAGVSTIEITYTLSSNTVIYLQFENIKIASVSADYLNAVTPTISGHPIDAAVNVGGTANLTVTASGGASLRYQWYSNTTNSNSGGSLIAGANAATYSAPTATNGTTYYYCVVTNTDTDAINETKTVTSNTAAVVVNNLINAAAPTITSQPQDTIVVAGDPASLSVLANVASGDLSYKWYSNTTDSNIGGSLISGANTSTYSFTPSSAGVAYYYCVVTNTDTNATGSQTATATSDAASVTATHDAGTYTFSGLGTTGSAGTEHTSLGDLFKVPNSMYSATPSLNASTGDKTALYFSSASTTMAKIMAENNGTCGSFTFKDLGVSAFESANSFSSFVIVLKDNLGKELANETLGASSSSSIPTTSIVNLSLLYPSHGEWNVAGVSTIEITFTLSSKDVTYLQFENIKIANISTDTLINAEMPTMDTQPASSVTSTGATLNGTVNANNASTAVTFEYGTTTSYGTSVTAAQSPVTGTSATSVSYALSGLTPNTTYYYRVVGVNTAGTTNGLDKTFTTSAVVPSVTTDSASSVTSTGATLNGTINANNASTTVTFEYGTTTSYGSSVTAAQSPVTGTSATSVSYALSGLTPNTTYYYRVVGVNTAGTTNGDDGTFITMAVKPTVTTNTASSITSTGATLNGTINANNASTAVTFEYGTTTSYGTSVTADQSPVTGTSATSVSYALSGLTPNTTYYYRVVGVNTAGTTNGLDKTFTTSPVTATVSSVSATNGTVSIVLDQVPTVAPAAADFTATSKIDGGTANSLALTGFAWNAGTKTVTYGYTEIAQTAASQSVVIAVSYNSAAAIEATAVTVAALPQVPVTATVSTVSATNGTVSIVLDQVPTVAPVATDFTATSKIDGGTANSLSLTGFAWDAGTKTVTYNFTAIAKTAASQSVVVAVSYNSAAAIEASTFTVEAAPVTATVSSVVATNGTVSIVLDRVPTVAPVAADFTATSKIDGGTANGLSLTGFAWNAGTKTVTCSFAAIAKTAASQSVVVAVSYNSAAPVESSAFTVDAAPVTATVSSVVATNGTVSIVLDQVPTVAPVAADFTATSKIDGGTAISLALTGFAWNAGTKTVTYGYTEIAQTAASQSVVIAVSYKSAAAVEATAFTVAALPPVQVTATVSTVSATNGTVKIVLDKVPTVAPVVADFTATSKIDGGAANSLSLTGFAWNATTKTVTYSFSAIAKTAASQSVVVAVSYNSAAAVEATSFTVAALPQVPVTATVSSVSATNGTVSIVLDQVPTVAPVAADFTATSTIATGSAISLPLSNFVWDATTKTVTYSFTSIAKTVASQSVLITVSYKGAAAIDASAFTVDALSTVPPVPVTATVSTVSATNGTVTIVLDQVPTVAPISSDFTATSTIATGSAISLSLSNFVWDATTKTVTYSFAAIAKTVASQSVVIAVSYKGAAAIYASAFTVDALSTVPPVPVTATVSTVSATNGTVSIVLDQVPTVAPVAADFTATSKINGGTANSLSLTGFAWDAGTKTVTYSFTLVAKTAASQSVVIAVSYKSAAFVSAPAYTVEASTTGGGSSGSTTTPAPPTPVETGVEILINGKIETVATAVTTKVEDKTVTTVTVDDKKVDEKLQNGSKNAVVTISVKNDADVVVGQLNGQMVKNMEAKEAVLEIKTENVTYTIPASQINIDNVSVQIGQQTELKDITVRVTIAEPSKDTVRIIENTANKNSYQMVVKPVDFEITCTSGNKTVDISKFNGYVERTIAIPDGIDPSKITTGIVLNSDGTFSHVPTAIIKIDGKYYAKINSLTNSTYSVIWSPKTFKDVETHWAKEAINDMGSRLVIAGVQNNNFEPNKDITRAEFATIVVKALGLMKPGTGEDSFNDVAKEAWYYDAVSIAYEYGIVSGNGKGNFAPKDKITREQAMSMVAKAMKITGLNVELKADEVGSLLAPFADSVQSSVGAKDNIAACVKAGIITGRSGKIAPKDYISRAETAVVVRKLLKKSNLI